MATQDTPTPIEGGLGDSQSEARSGFSSPALRASGLPSHASPKVAAYASGPFLVPELVTPSDWRWRGTRTFVVHNALDGLDYRAILVSSDGNLVGYWAVERLGEPLTLPELEN